MNWDVIVLGLGGMGSAALAQLAARGVRVLGLEQFEPMHGLGSSHGNSRIIRQTYFLDSRYVALAKRAYELWKDLERFTGERLMTISGGLMLGARDDEIVDGALRSAQEHDLAHELLDADELRRRFPPMSFRDGEWALYEPTAGYLRPEACIHAHLARAVAAGAQARFGVRVPAWEESADGVRIRTDAGESLEARKLVITAGAWLGKVTTELALPLRVERQVMHWFSPATRAEEPALQTLPIYIVDRDDGRAYGFPFVAGEGLKVAFYRSFEPTDVDNVDRDVRPDEIAPVRKFLEGLIPGAAAQYQRSKVCLYTLTPDEHFIIGMHPQHRNVVLAGGFSGHGFKFCSVVGEIVAQLAIDGATQHAIEFFSPQRFLPMKSRRQRASRRP
jgi:sarcosine oxidase